MILLCLLRLKVQCYRLREYMFSSVYTNKKAKSQEEQAVRLLRAVVCILSNHVEQLPQEYYITYRKVR